MQYSSFGLNIAWSSKGQAQVEPRSRACGPEALRLLERPSHENVVHKSFEAAAYTDHRASEPFAQQLCGRGPAYFAVIHTDIRLLSGASERHADIVANQPAAVPQERELAVDQGGDLPQGVDGQILGGTSLPLVDVDELHRGREAQVVAGREHLAAVKAVGDMITLNTMRFAHEIVDAGELNLPKKAEISKKEMDLANTLIDSMADKFDPKKYKDEHRERVLALIEAKAEGAEIVTQPAAEEPTLVGDLERLVALRRRQLREIRLDVLPERGAGGWVQETLGRADRLVEQVDHAVSDDLVLSLREREFVKLAEIAGASRTRVILRHVVPNVLNSAMVLASLQIGVVIIAEASLSFLGVGVPPPQPAWAAVAHCWTFTPVTSCT